MNLKGKKIRLHDVSLRDGMHSVHHQLTLQNMQQLSSALDQAKVALIEIGHGDGLAGSSVNYGFSLHSDKEYLGAVAPQLKNSRVSVVMTPGISTVEDLKTLEDTGINTVRVATHCTEADVAEQHIHYAVKQGFDTVGFLMMSHTASPHKILEQARLMHDYGANCLYIADSAGHMLPENVAERIRTLCDAFPESVEVGFHGHNNLGMSVANSLAAVEAGATRIDGSVAGFGAGAGNMPLEVFAAVCEMHGVETGVDLAALIDSTETVAVPIMGKHLPRIDRDALTLGYAGVYSSFLLHAKRAEQRHGISARKILLELGHRGTVNGQEDMIEDVALEMLRKRAS
ncbi:unnamed protein product [Cyprideis torosa]|uniref:4-hydroxy-2-oxohexanoate aldolase n=1 Tax=Cyprideis torosa TaxID=163714 RepID=A0A7R8WNI6_9CRUS|nr:unnamed protein product [Cyprideis torosa]CAG0904787.1 unnamed protein product [Cyprideis torosa]